MEILEHGAAGGDVDMPVAGGDAIDTDIGVGDNGALMVDKVLSAVCSTRSFYQGCVLEMLGSCVPVQLTMHKWNKLCPSTRCVIQLDDAADVAVRPPTPAHITFSF